MPARRRGGLSRHHALSAFAETMTTASAAPGDEGGLDAWLTGAEVDDDVVVGARICFEIFVERGDAASSSACDCAGGHADDVDAGDLRGADCVTDLASPRVRARSGFPWTRKFGVHGEAAHVGIE